MPYKIGLLIPSTSRGRYWSNIFESYLYTHLIKTLINTYNEEHNYIIYTVVDDDDKIYSNFEEKNKLKKYLSTVKNLDIKFLSSNGIPKGHVTLMWNRAFKHAYDEKCDYFFQCGDDIKFINKNWVNSSIQLLKKHNNIGLTGPLDYIRWKSNVNSRPGGKRFIQTQSFVSRKHMDLFQYYFPPEIKNWYCDDWMTNIYYPKYYYYMDKFIINDGGTPRYEVIGSLNRDDPIRRKCFELVNKHKKDILNYITKEELEDVF